MKKTGKQTDTHTLYMPILLIFINILLLIIIIFIFSYLFILYSDENKCIGTTRGRALGELLAKHTQFVCEFPPSSLLFSKGCTDKSSRSPLPSTNKAAPTSKALVVLFNKCKNLTWQFS